MRNVPVDIGSTTVRGLSRTALKLVAQTILTKLK